MNRRNWLYAVTGLLATPLLSGRAAGANEKFAVSKSRDEWKKLLSAAAYQDLFEDGTERAVRSALNNERRPGS